MTDKQMDQVLEELGREHRAISAPDSLQRVLYTAAESRRAAVGAPRLQPRWAWAAVAIVLAMAAGVGVVWRSLHTQQAQTQEAHSQPAPQVSAEAGQSSPTPARHGLQPTAKPVRVGVKARATLGNSSPAEAPAASSLDAFVPLPASEGLPAAAELSIVRMRLRGSDLQQYGLQAPADAFARTMLAEFAVGEDGLPRAIRILR
jgi:hypothetical protein